MRPANSAFPIPPFLRRPSRGRINFFPMAGPFIPHGMPRMPRSPRASGSPGPEEHKADWSERLQALKYVAPLLRMVYQTHRGYTIAIVVLRIVRGVIPLGVLWVGKLIIDGVARSVDWAYLTAMRQRLATFLPLTGQLELRKVWAATIDYTPDHQPILGPAIRPDGRDVAVCLLTPGKSHAYTEPHRLA